MISQIRYDAILKKLSQQHTVTLAELVDHLQVSESTIRRDLITLDKMGKLKKIHGGATRIDHFLMEEMNLSTKANLAKEEKELIATYAAQLVNPNDLVYIDAGTTTDLMIKYLTVKDAIYITNGMAQAQNLIAQGLRCFIIGGEIKSITGAIIGPSALNSLRNLNFTKGFFGSNGISINTGYSTPDPVEATVKREALNRCQQAYVLADSSKFDCTCHITFGNLTQAHIITDVLKEEAYRRLTTVIEASKELQ